MSIIPALPARTVGDTWGWSSGIYAAHTRIRHVCDRIETLLRQEESDQVRLGVSQDTLTAQVIPLLTQMVPELRAGGALEWVAAVSAEIGRMQAALDSALEAASDRCEHYSSFLLPPNKSQPFSEHRQVVRLDPIVVERSGRPGRPKKVISRSWLEETFAPYRKITIQQAAEALGVHRNTVSNYMKKYGITTQYTPLLDEEVDQMVRGFKLERPNAGIRHVHSFFRVNWIRIQRERVIESLRRIDGIGKSLPQVSTS